MDPGKEKTLRFVMKFISNSPEDTKNIAKKLALKVSLGDIVILEGDFGAGKTVFVKGFCEHFGIPEKEVISPSFVVMNIYQNENIKVYHFDFYRLSSFSEISDMGFFEYIDDDNAIKLIEWNKLNIQVGKKIWIVNICHLSEKKRKIEICEKGTFSLTEDNSPDLQ